MRGPEDLEGLKIRVMNSATAIQMVDTMGGSPTPIAWGELYSALQQGIVDGAENNLPSFYNNKHYEVCKHLSLNEHSRVPDMLMMSSKVWKKLSPQQRDWVQQAANDSSAFQRDLWRKEEQATRDLAKAEGVTIYEVELAAFAEKVEPMLQSVKNAEVRALLEEIRSVN